MYRVPLNEGPIEMDGGNGDDVMFDHRRYLMIAEKSSPPLPAPAKSS